VVLTLFHPRFVVNKCHPRHSAGFARNPISDSGDFGIESSSRRDAESQRKRFGHSSLLSATLREDYSTRGRRLTNLRAVQRIWQIVVQLRPFVPPQPTPFRPSPWQSRFLGNLDDSRRNNHCHKALRLAIAYPRRAIALNFQ
jgi:hypothetical protein